MFNVGDRVKAKRFGEGIIVEVDTGNHNECILVQFDNHDINLHDGNKKCKGSYPKRCWYYKKHNNVLTKINYPSLVITTDGHTTTAIYDGRSAKAKCNPADTFDLMIGAQLALKRLLTKPHLEYYSTEYPIGQVTNIKDIRGVTLHTGDEIEWWDGGCLNEGVILDNGLISHATTCIFDYGVCDDIRIIRKRGFADIKHGETIDDVKYIKEAE